MKFEEIKRPGMKFVGVGVDTSVQKAAIDCHAVWMEFTKRYKEIKHYTGGMKNYGVCFEKSKKDCAFRYAACAQVKEFEDIPKGMEEHDVPPSEYLMFIHKGKMEKLGETYWKIMEEMKKLDVKQGKHWIEFYDHRWRGDKDESLMEIWVPIITGSLLGQK